MPLRVAEQLKQQIDEFQEKLPLISALCNKGLRDRHWEQISKARDPQSSGWRGGCFARSDPRRSDEQRLQRSPPMAYGAGVGDVDTQHPAESPSRREHMPRQGRARARRDPAPIAYARTAIRAVPSRVAVDGRCSATRSSRRTRRRCSRSCRGGSTRSSRSWTRSQPSPRRSTRSRRSAIHA